VHVRYDRFDSNHAHGSQQGVCLYVGEGVKLPHLLSACVCEQVGLFVQPLQEDSGKQGSVIRALRFVLRGCAVPATLQDLFDEHEEDDWSKVPTSVAVARLMKALCLSARTVKGALRLHRSCGMLTTNDISYFNDAFTFLPAEWRKQLWRPAVREEILQRMDALFHGVEAEEQVMEPADSEPPAGGGGAAKAKRRRRKAHGMRALVDEESRLYFDGFRTWFRPSADIAGFNADRGTLAQGFLFMLMQVGSAYGVTIDRGQETNPDLLLMAALAELPINSDAQSRALHSLIERQFTYVGAGVEAVRWGADPVQCRPSFYFRADGYKLFEDVKALHQGYITERYMVSPLLWLSSLESMVPLNDESALAKASAALRNFAVLERKTGPEWASSTGQISLLRVNEPWWFGWKLVAGRVNLFAMTSTDVCRAALADVLRQDVDPQPGAFIRAFQARLSQVPVAQHGISSDQEQSMPLASLCASWMRNASHTMNLYIQQFAQASFTRFRNSLSATQQAAADLQYRHGLSMTRGHSSLTMPVENSEVVDIATMPTALCSAMEPFLRGYHTQGVSMSWAAYANVMVAPTISHMRDQYARFMGAMTSIAIQQGYRPGMRQGAYNHQLVAWAETREAFHRVSDAEWPSVHNYMPCVEDARDAFLSRRLNPACMMPLSTLTRSNNMSLSTDLLVESLDAVTRLARVRRVGSLILMMKMYHCTALLTVRMCGHLFVFGTSSSGKSLSVKVTKMLGFSERYLQNDGESAKAMVSGNESADGFVNYLNEASGSLVGKAPVMNGHNAAGANTDSNSQGTLLVRLDEAHHRFLRTVKVETKTDQGTSLSTFRPAWITSSSENQFTILSNMQGDQIAAPVACRMTAMLLTGGMKGTFNSNMQPARPEALLTCDAHHRWDAFSVFLTEKNALIRAGVFPTDDVDAVTAFLTSFFTKHHEVRLGQGERHPMTPLPAFSTARMQQVSTGKPDSHSTYTRDRLLDVLLLVMTRVCVALRTMTTLTYLAPILNYIPGYGPADMHAISARYSVAGPEDAIMTAWTQGTYDTLLVSADNVRLMHFFLQPMVRSLFHALKLYAHIVRYAYGVREGLPLLSTMDQTGDSRRGVVTPLMLVQAVLNTTDDAGMVLLNELSNLRFGYWQQAHNVWLLWLASFFAARCGSLMHASRRHAPVMPIAAASSASATSDRAPLFMRRHATAEETLRRRAATAAAAASATGTPLARGDSLPQQMSHLFQQDTRLFSDATRDRLSPVAPAPSSPPAPVNEDDGNDGSSEAWCAQQWNHLQTMRATLAPEHECDFVLGEEQLQLLCVVGQAVHTLQHTMRMSQAALEEQRVDVDALSEEQRDTFFIEHGKLMNRAFSRIKSHPYVFLPHHGNFSTIETQMRALIQSAGAGFLQWINPVDVQTRLTRFQEDSAAGELPVPVTCVHSVPGLRAYLRAVREQRPGDKLLSKVQAWAHSEVSKPAEAAARRQQQQQPQQQQQQPPSRKNSWPIWTPVQSTSSSSSAAAADVPDEHDLELLAVLTTLVQSHTHATEVTAEDLRLLKSGILDVASENVMNLYGVVRQGPGSAVVVHTMDMRNNTSPTILAILDALDEVAAADYNGPILFTHPFDTVCASAPGEIAEGVLPTMHVPACQAGRSREAHVDPNTQGGLAIRLQALQKRGFLRKQDALPHTFTVTDDHEFRLRMREGHMPQVAHSVRCMFRQACVAFVAEHGMRDCVEAADEGDYVDQMVEALENSFRTSNACREFLVRFLYADPAAMKSYPGTAATGHEERVAMGDRVPTAVLLNKEETRDMLQAQWRQAVQTLEEHKERRAADDVVSVLERNMGPVSARAIHRVAYQDPERMRQWTQAKERKNQANENDAPPDVPGSSDAEEENASPRHDGEAEAVAAVAADMEAEDDEEHTQVNDEEVDSDFDGVVVESQPQDGEDDSADESPEVPQDKQKEDVIRSTKRRRIVVSQEEAQS
jgi:hypothetical protein